MSERRKYALQHKEPNPYIRNELRKNMTNLPERWVDIAQSDSLDRLKDLAAPGHRIVRLNGLEVVHEPQGGQQP